MGRTKTLTSRESTAQAPKVPKTLSSRSHGLTLLSAFTGAGGLDLGLEAAGFETIACIESDVHARATLRENRPHWNQRRPGLIEEAAQSLSPATLELRAGELTVLAGGPPCQPFSKAAQWSARAKNGLEDHRSHCILSFFQLLKAFLPEAMLIENVSGFVKGKTSAVPAIESRLAQINQQCDTSYRLSCRILDAADYGVPQRRERAIMVALRNGRAFEWPEPTHKNNPVRAWDALAEVKLERENVPTARGKWSGLLPSIPEGANYQWHTEKGGGRQLFGYRTRFWSFLLKLAKDQPAWTVPAQPGPGTGPFHWENRPLHVSEMLRLQTFPLDWSVKGDLKEQVRQIGNATPPLLAEIIGRRLAELLRRRQTASPFQYSIEFRTDLPKPSRTKPVPAEYLKLEGRHRAHPGPGKGPKPVLAAR